MNEIFAVRITEFPTKQLDSILSIFPEVRRHKIQKFCFISDKLRSVTGDILKRVILSKILKLPITELRFDTDHYGKPFLLGQERNIGFNVSHSGEWVVLAVSPSGRIGVDIEQIKFIQTEVAERFFSDEEFKSVIKFQSEELRLLRFFEIWTAKESYVKATGKGLSTSLNSFSTTNGVNSMALEKSLEDEVWFFRQFSIKEGYILTACSNINDFNNQVHFLNIDYLVQAFLHKPIY